jgi:hypothetical protein
VPLDEQRLKGNLQTFRLPRVSWAIVVETFFILVALGALLWSL